MDPGHIEAHFPTCCRALTVLRPLELGSDLPCPSTREEIAAMAYSKVDATWWVSDQRTNEPGVFVEAVGLEDPKLKNLRTGKAGKILARWPRATYRMQNNHGNLELSADRIACYLKSAAEVRMLALGCSAPTTFCRPKCGGIPICPDQKLDE